MIVGHTDPVAVLMIILMYAIPVALGLFVRRHPRRPTQ